MATAIQRRRGNTAQHASFTGLAGEITIDTDKNTVVVHDGVTAGGYPLAKADDVEALGGADITAVIAGDGLTGGASSGNATINVVGGDGITVNADSVAVNATYVKGLVSATDAGGDGSFAYDNSTGVFTYTGPSQAEANARIDARLSGGTGITYTSGVIATTITQYTDADARDAVSASGDLNYDSGTGVFSFTERTDAEVRGLISVSGDLSYDSGTGVISYTEPTMYADSDARAAISVTDNGGDGSLSYNSGTGVITYTGPSASEVRAHFSAGTGVTLSSGQISIGQAVGTTDNVTFGDLVVSGNLTVSGATTTVNTETINLADNIIVLNSNEAGTPSQNAGIEVERGTSTNVQLRWNETDDKWQFTNDGSTYQNVLTDAAARALISVTDSGGDGSLVYDNSTGVITYSGPSATEVRAHLSAGTGLSYSSGQFSISDTSVAAGVYGNGTSVPQVTVNAQGQITSASNLSISISSGQVSDFATAARGNISVTDAGGDGSMSYNSSTGVITYTGPSQTEANSRIDAYLSGGTGVTVSSGTISIGQAVGTGDSVTFATVTADLTGDVTGTVSDLSNHDTADLAEGTNLYFTAARARGNISVTDSGGYGSLAYDSGTGVITYTGPSDADIRGTISVTDAGGDGSLSYNSGTGVITYTGPSASEVRAHFSAGTGVSISSGAISIGQAVGTTDNVSFNNVTATANFFGNLTGNVTGNVSGNAGTATALATSRTIALSGDVTGSATFNGTGDATITATIAANSVALGTDTTGNYVASVSNGAYITGGSAGSEGAALTLAVDATTTATASKVAARDASGDLYANIFQGTASSARYADLAERYEADAILEPGTVVCFGGEKEITACDHENDHAVAGVVSTDPAYMMNSAAGNNDTHPYIALTGRVPVKVVGPVAKGDLLVASGVKGHAMANNNAKAGTIIGKAIGSIDSGEGVVEALINLM